MSNFMNEPIVNQIGRFGRGMAEASGRMQEGMARQPPVDYSGDRQQMQGMQFPDGMNTNIAQSMGGMFSPQDIENAQAPEGGGGGLTFEQGSMDDYNPPRRTVRDLEPWEDKLDLFKGDRNSAIEEILRAKEIFEEEAEAYGKGFPQTKRGKQISNWAKQVREASGLTEKEFSAAVSYSQMQQSLAPGEIGAQKRMLERY